MSIKLTGISVTFHWSDDQPDQHPHTAYVSDGWNQSGLDASSPRYAEVADILSRIVDGMRDDEPQVES